MKVIDYNGVGIWRVEEVLGRYQEYVRKYEIQSPLKIDPRVYDSGDTRRIYPIMDQIIEGIEAGDVACAEIGVEFIEEDVSFPFGMTLKSNTARALRRASLPDELKQRIRQRVLAMLQKAYLPQEYRQYAKLARKIGLGSSIEQLKASMPTGDPRVDRYVKYFEEHAGH